MTLTWTFYPSGQPVVTLTVIYVSSLDSGPVTGYLETETNTAYVGWNSFRIFDKGDLAEKKILFGSLIRLARFDADSI